MRILDRELLREITGAQQKNLQIEWLQANNIPRLVNRDGRAVVMADIIERLLSGERTSEKSDWTFDETRVPQDPSPAAENAQERADLLSGPGERIET